MKIIHIKAKANIENINFDTNELPKKIGIVTTVQYTGALKKLELFLKEKKFQVFNAIQILGCKQNSAIKIKDKVDAFLYFGTGKFHPIGLAINTNKPIFILDPISMKISKIEKEETEKILKKKKGMFAKFLSSNKIGILISMKPGQNRVQGGLQKIKEIENQYLKKEFYYFLNETLDFNELNNFPFIECWLNSMCPRIMEDIKVLNIKDLDLIQ